jgi:hypothetical protein
MSEKRTSPGYYLAVVVLGGLLLAAAFFVIAMIARPGTPGASVLAVTDRIPVDCSGEPTGTFCFETLVTNNGSDAGTFRCQVRATDESQATFVEGATSTQILLGVDQSVHLRSLVTVTGKTQPSPPSVTCESVSV